jgi:hypothetical protein
MALTIALGCAYLGWSVIAATPEDRMGCAIAGALFGTVFGVPVGLGMGYVWGTWMAGFYGYKPDA